MLVRGGDLAAAARPRSPCGSASAARPSALTVRSSITSSSLVRLPSGATTWRIRSIRTAPGRSRTATGWET